MPQADITIKLYEPWMREQIIRLTEKEYPTMEGWFSKRFHALHESEYLKDRNHIITAVQGSGKVVACISYIYWPLSFGGKSLNSFQMVGLLVDPSARGQGLFRKVLSRMDELLLEKNPDVILGFPVHASKQGFLKQGFKNSFDLVWYLRPVGLMSLFTGKSFSGTGFEMGNPEIVASDKYIQTAPDQEFWKLRADFFPEWPLYSKTYPEGDHKIQIIFRIQKVKKFNVAVLGRIYSGNASMEKIQQALKMWITDLRKNGTVLAAMAAVNEACPSAEQQAIRNIMFRLNKKITVIMKSPSSSPVVANPANWNLMRGDMETW